MIQPPRRRTMTNEQVTSRSDYVALQCLTHGTHLWSQIKPEQLPSICKEKKLKSIALTDVGNICMCVQYYKAMKDAGLKPIIGCQLNISDELSTIHHKENQTSRKLTIYAKNMAGWKQLLKIIYECNQPERFDKCARISLEELHPLLTDDLIVCGNHHFTDKVLHELGSLCSHFYIAINPIENMGAIKRLRALPYKKIGVTPNYYANKKDVSNNRVLLACYFKTNLRRNNDDKHPAFVDNRYYIHSLEEMLKLRFTPDELDNADEIYNLIEEFDITHKQELPHFSCPEGETETSYLRKLCEEGLVRLDLKDKKYRDRLEMELKQIQEAGMEGYFLIVQDFVNYARKKGWLVGMGRGSAGGCIISYLTGITGVDPIKYKLMFERFYSADRKGYPDIDIDFSMNCREEVVRYIRGKYGQDNFMQLCTFGTLKGAAALKRCMSTSRKEIGFAEQNTITKLLPAEAKLAADLKIQKNEHGTESLVFWCINNMEEFTQWCDSGFDGPYADEFKTAIELDQVIQSRGRHACAFALSTQPVYEVAPVVYDEVSKQFIVGVNMDDAESLGLVKMDLLAVDLLSKCQKVMEIVKNGYC